MHYYSVELNDIYWLDPPDGNIRECQFDGQWSGVLPHCIETFQSYEDPGALEAAADDPGCFLPEIPVENKVKVIK